MIANPILATAFLGLKPEARDIIDHIEQVASVIASLTMGLGVALLIGIKGLGFAALAGTAMYLLSIAACLLLMIWINHKKKFSADS